MNFSEKFQNSCLLVGIVSLGSASLSFADEHWSCSSTPASAGQPVLRVSLVEDQPGLGSFHQKAQFWWESRGFLGFLSKKVIARFSSSPSQGPQAFLIDYEGQDQPRRFWVGGDSTLTPANRLDEFATFRFVSDLGSVQPSGNWQETLTGRLTALHPEDFISDSKHPLIDQLPMTCQRNWSL